jgi:hypothetical protein
MDENIKKSSNNGNDESDKKGTFYVRVINPSAWSDGHCPHTVNITCRGVTDTARIQ